MTTTTTTCPAWCTHHAPSEADSHQSETWNGPGVTMSIEQTSEDGIKVYVDHGVDEYLSLTAEQAHELGTELVRAADRIRQAQRLTPDA